MPPDQLHWMDALSWVLIIFAAMLGLIVVLVPVFELHRPIFFLYVIPLLVAVSALMLLYRFYQRRKG